MKRLVVGVMMLFVLSIVTACSSNSYEEAIERGTEAYEEGLWKRAENEFQRALDEKEESELAKEWLEATERTLILYDAKDAGMWKDVRLLLDEFEQTSYEAIGRSGQQLIREKVEDVQIAYERHKESLGSYEQQIETIEQLVNKEAYERAARLLDELEDDKRFTKEQYRKLYERYEQLRELVEVGMHERAEERDPSPEKKEVIERPSKQERPDRPDESPKRESTAKQPSVPTAEDPTVTIVEPETPAERPELTTDEQLLEQLVQRGGWSDMQLYPGGEPYTNRYGDWSIQLFEIIAGDEEFFGDYAYDAEKDLFYDNYYAERGDIRYFDF